jgi:adenylylsulfate kinase
LKNLKEYNFTIDKKSRNSLNKHDSFVVWFTGLSGSGKSTICNSLEVRLNERGVNTITLDGDSVRNGLNKDLSFSNEDRSENIRRVAEVSKLFIDAGVVVLTSFISPFEKDRNLAREIIGDNNFLEIFVNTSLETCIHRDVKGLYAKSKSGELDNMTGIDSIYEAPKSPMIEIKENFELDQSVKMIFTLIENKLKLND